MSQSSTRVLHVAVPAPLRRVFDYACPEAGTDIIPAPGMRVRVPFGRSEAVGLVLAVDHRSDVPPAKLKPALALLDEEPLISPALLALLQFAADYYHHPIGEVAELMLPVALRTGAPALRKPEFRWRCTDAGLAVDLGKLGRAPRQAQALALLRRHPEGVAESLLRAEAVEGQTLKALAEKAWAERETVTVVTRPDNPVRETPPELNPEQAAALAALRAGDGFRSALLDGVTGSGKTEVYLQRVADCVAAGRQALILVPEIGLTPQTVSRFEARFCVPIALLHSGLADGERLDAWLSARDGEARIVLGTRSALFTPMPELGIILVDEEHDLSYKQQDGLRYSARDLALVRGRLENIPVVLGSATPALESLHLAQTRRHQHLRLPNRAGSAKPPRIQVLDVRKLPLDEGLSPPLIQAMRSHLAGDGQVLLFLNRRGYAPVLMCHACGWASECQRCDARYTLHQDPRQLRCHHCDSIRSIPERCPNCREDSLIAVGLGTERMEARLAELFPDIGIVRIDRDSTRRKGALDRHLEGIASGEYRLLVGTQMLAKGHHFPRVTLVALPDIDSALFSSDFRAPERLAQLLTQVGGRAGRAERPGEVWLQTHQPDHPALTTLIRQGYSGFAAEALRERQAALLPPFRHLALLRAEAVAKDRALNFLAEVKSLCRDSGLQDVHALGPAPAPMERRAGRYRAQLLLDSEERRPLHQLLSWLMPQLERLASGRQVRWSLDVDPQEML